MQRMTSSQGRTATRAAARARMVRMRGAERSTDGEAFAAYAESIALLATIVSVLAAVWLVMLPSETATLAMPAPPSPTTAEFVLEPGGHAIQPDVAGPPATAVAVDGPLLGAPLAASGA